MMTIERFSLLYSLSCVGTFQSTQQAKTARAENIHLQEPLPSLFVSQTETKKRHIDYKWLSVEKVLDVAQQGGEDGRMVKYLILVLSINLVGAASDTR